MGIVRGQKGSSMKRHYDGKVYDTNSAQRLASTPASERMDAAWTVETLYRKRTGEYFLHGEGGPESRYGKVYPAGLWSDGEMIIPQTADQAREWARKNLTADERATLFAPPRPIRMTSVRITDTARDTIQRAARRRGMTTSQLLSEIAAGLDKAPEHP